MVQTWFWGFMSIYLIVSTEFEYILNNFKIFNLLCDMKQSVTTERITTGSHIVTWNVPAIYNAPSGGIRTQEQLRISILIFYL